MDSRLLNTFHDDPFEGNNVGKFDNGTEFWINNNETMSMELTDTLHGILPIAATDAMDIVGDIYSGSSSSSNCHNAMLKDDFHVPLNYKNNQNLICNGFIDDEIPLGGDGVEIITIDPNADDFNSDNGTSTRGHYIDLERRHLSMSDESSECSYATFRTRTESSSIGDYESRTSDFDDFDENEEVINAVLNSTRESALLLPDNLLLRTTNKDRTLSTNTIGSDIDGFGLHIDANNFDLAEFITKDDFVVNAAGQHSQATEAQGTSTKRSDAGVSDLIISPVVQIASSKESDSDSDSDIIVDVETIEIDSDAENLLWQAHRDAVTSVSKEEVAYVDNEKQDPSWDPNRKKKPPSVDGKEGKGSAEKSVQGMAGQQRCVVNVPNKRQCDFLKGKFGRGKNINGNQRQGKAGSKTAPAPERRIGIGKGGKNLSLINRSRSDSERDSSPVKTGGKLMNAPNHAEPVRSPSTAKQTMVTTVPPVVKRKLNLEEYKKRREAQLTGNGSRKIESFKIPKIETHVATAAIPSPNSHPPLTPTKHSEEVISVVKSLKEPPKLAEPIDPITLARNKVLRMQQLKKAQQLRIIDSTVSAKVPKVTKILPLKEMVKDTYRVEYEDQGNGDNANGRRVMTTEVKLKGDPEYEEIVVVSVSCNTDITRPPRSLLKSSVLLHNISDTFQKVQATETVKISSSSLIASIQDVVVKKTLPATRIVATGVKQSNAPAMANVDEQHGEDKIIMHLRKDRIRKQGVSIATQTDLEAEYPPLPLVKRMPHKTSRQYRRQSVEGPTGEGYESDESSRLSKRSNERRSRSRSRSEASSAHSCSSLTEHLPHNGNNGNETGGGYSSRSSRRHRSSISSSYSESERRFSQTRRLRKTSFKQRQRKRSRTSSSSSSSGSVSGRSDRSRSRSPFYRGGGGRRSRSRSRSLSAGRDRWNRNSGYQNNSKFVDRNVSKPAVEERRIVYVGRIEEETTKDMLRRKFLPYGTIKQITIHYKETGMKYGFVTFERSQDAFTAIDSSSKDPQINMYDISFGGRRAFCRQTYADLDNAGINTYHSFVFPKQAPPPKEDDSFEALLLKVKAKMNAVKGSGSSSMPSPSPSPSSSSNRDNI